MKENNMVTLPSILKWTERKAICRPAILPVAVSCLAFLSLFLSAASATTFHVMVGNGGFNFTPSSVTIRPGDTVQWTWSASGHSTTSGNPGFPNGIWDSGVLDQGATFSHTFNSTGSFPYYCTPH